MRVLMLVTNDEAPFFRQQIGALEDAGVECTTLAVPQSGSDGRTRRDYLHFYESVLTAVTESYDVVHANYGLTAPAALAQPRRPVVLSLWGSDLLGRYGWLSKLCAGRASEVIVMSSEMANELETDAQVIPHAVDLDRFRPRSREQAREAVGWESEGVNVLFPYGPDRPIKNFPRARRIVDRVQEEADRPVKLRQIYEVPHEAMPDYMNASDVLLLTSDSEGSPNSVKEALACDVPVVSTDVGDVSEYTGPLEYSGVATTDELLVDRLGRIVRDAPISEGREQVQDLGVDTMRTRLLEVYESVLEDPPEVVADV